jgi:hypothetical protein
MALLAALVLAGCSSRAAPSASPPCAAAAEAYNGQVVGFEATTLSVARGFSVIAGDPRLSALAPTEPAYVCFIDGQIPKAPPPLPGETPAPPFDRAMVVAVGTVSDLIEAGYRTTLPVPSNALVT